MVQKHLIKRKNMQLTQLIHQITSILPVSGWKFFAGSSVVIRHWIAYPCGNMLCCTRPSSPRDFPSAILIWDVTKSILKEHKSIGHEIPSNKKKLCLMQCFLYSQTNEIVFGKYIERY